MGLGMLACRVEGGNWAASHTTERRLRWERRVRWGLCGESQLMASSWRPRAAGGRFNPLRRHLKSSTRTAAIAWASAVQLHHRRGSRGYAAAVCPRMLPPWRSRDAGRCGSLSEPSPPVIPARDQWKKVKNVMGNPFEALPADGDGWEAVGDVWGGGDGSVAGEARAGNAEEGENRVPKHMGTLGVLTVM